MAFLGHRTVRKIIAFVPMYICFYLGELGFQICDRWPGEWSDNKTVMDRIGTFFYNVYQRGMGWSHDLNNWADFKLWYVDEEEKAKHG